MFSACDRILRPETLHPYSPLATGRLSDTVAFDRSTSAESRHLDVCSSWMDRVLVTGLLIDQLCLSPAPWAHHKHQAAYLDISVHTDVSQAGSTDDLTFSINYSSIAKSLRNHFSKENYPHDTKHLSAYSLAQAAAYHLLYESNLLSRDTDAVTVQATLPEALLHGGRLVCTVTRSIPDYSRTASTSSGSLNHYDSPNIRADSLEIRDWQVSTVLGLNDCERLQEQPLQVEVQAWPNLEGFRDTTDMAWCARTLQETTWQHVRSTHPLLLENFCTTLSQDVLAKCSVPKVRVRLDKPKAVIWTSTTAVEATRHRSFFSISPRSQCIPPTIQRARALSTKSTQNGSHSTKHTAYVAFGSNLGNRYAYIKEALDDLNGGSPEAVCEVLDTSFLYESEPMYVLEQDRFLNGVVRIRTALTPQDLLARLKAIEQKVGRRKTIEKGPRQIDLDVLLYDDNVILRDEQVDLTIPHPLISEREFVLRPLAEYVCDFAIHAQASDFPTSLAPNLIHPILKQSVREMLRALPVGTGRLRQVTPLLQNGTMLDLSGRSRTRLMSILNVTPDSFSDGGAYATVADAVQQAVRQAEDGADIIDVGGVSTRPGSTHVTEEEELRRVVPVVEGIRKAGVTVPISVDTYRASVAEKVVAAGASIINDISGGLHDPDMFSTVAKLDVPFVLMHMRGKPEEVNNAKHQSYEKNDVAAGVRKELADATRKALAAGIKRWNILLDPGIGFSKNLDGNLQLLRNLPAVTGRSASPLSNSDGFSSPLPDEDGEILCGFPVLVGLSRKRFIGTITGKDVAIEREHGNSALHALCVAQGAKVLRVHDVAAAKDAVRCADAVYGHLDL